MPDADRRSRLLQEALQIVSAEGLAAVTHRSVEKAAGAPHGSVTYWFGTREGLIAALVDDLCDESERQVGAIAAAVEAQLVAGRMPDLDGIARGLAEWMDGGAAHHLARMELELQAARDPAHAARMTRAAGVFWQMCAAISAMLGSENPERDGRARAAMIDGLLLDRLAHQPQDHELLVAALRMLLGVSGSAVGSQPGPPNT